MSKKLEAYAKKRNFKKTAEPPAQDGNDKKSLSAKGAPLRFAVQHHMARREHYDLRLEWEGTLLSWAVPKGPSYKTGDKRLAIHVEDHPISYKDFEGTIPKGEYGGGTVMLWDKGTWHPRGDAAQGLCDGVLKFTLKGHRLKGSWALVRIDSDKKALNEKSQNWLLLKEKDSYAAADSGISQFVTSIKTGRTMQQIAAGVKKNSTLNPIKNAQVQLAKFAADVPDSDDWLYEIKYDGYRIAAYADSTGVQLLTRNGNDYTEKFNPIKESLQKWSAGRAMVLDGEVVISGSDGKTDFQALQNYIKSPDDKNLLYIVFDVLALDGEDLRGQILKERKQILEELMQSAPANICLSKTFNGDGNTILQAVCDLGLEGIIGKRIDSAYTGKRDGKWIKLKCRRTQIFVIGGYTVSDKNTSGISSLLLGAYNQGNLEYTGRAGTGISHAAAGELYKKFSKIRDDRTPFINPPKKRYYENIFWLKPKYLAEINFAERTNDNLLRQASFKGIIERQNAEMDVGFASDKNKNHNKVKRKKMNKENIKTSSAEDDKDIVISGVKISSPQKIMFTKPEIRKIEIIEYYKRVSRRMLPYVGDRVLSIVRCPKGITGECFYKKNAGQNGKQVLPVEVKSNKGNEKNYFYISDTAGLIAEAQMCTLEFHVWGSKISSLEKPDMMVFDLDPDEGMGLDKVRRGVRDIKQVLDSLSLKSYLKTSGGKGYHVVVPFKPLAEWDVFYSFAKRIAELCQAKWPDRYTSNMRKERRKGKIFIDWVRNGRGATSIAPYSVRAREGAKVSMPISWRELDTVKPDGIDMDEAIKRLKKRDPWQGFYKTEQEITAVLK